MKHVTFTRDLAPYHAGDKRLVPDDVARDLEARGEILPDPPDFPVQLQRPTVIKPRRPLLTRDDRK